MVDMSNDGLGDALDVEVRVIGMELMRIVQETIRKLKERKEEEAKAQQAQANQAKARYDAQVTLARADLGPVMSDRFWKDADLDTIREKYALAAGLAGTDPQFIPFARRIEQEAKERHDLSPKALLEGPVPPGPRPMTDDQLRQFVQKVPPPWYKVWASERTAELDKIRDPQERLAGHAEHAAVVRADMTHWRDTGTLSENARRVQGEWLDGEHRTWKNRKVDPKADFTRLTDEQRASFGWRPGGPKIVGPLDVDDARLMAATTAPGWYRVQELVAVDVAPAIRERLESRLVEDMTRLRDTGKLDTPSAKEEWARFSGHPMSAAEQDPNESLAEFRARREETFRVHWAATELDRENVQAPHGEHTGKPMSVSEAEEFAQRFAPDWLRERHSVLMEEAGKQEDPERGAWEQTNLREQFRYAMEEARDTGALSHPYVASLRGNAAFMGIDESEGMRSVPEADRVRFGGPAARPMSHDEALEVMAGWAPDWYRDQVNRTLRENNMLSESAKRIELDAVRTDMTALRDRGVLNTDHAKRLWATSQPGFDPTDPDSRKAVDRREQLWVETMGSRPGPSPMDPNNRERLGGRREPVTAPIPVVDAPRPQERAQTAKEGPSPEQVRETVEEAHRGRPRGVEPVVPAPAQSFQSWDVAPIPRASREPQEAQEPHRKKQDGPVYDSVARREHDAARARAKGISPDAVEGMTAVDYGHPYKPGKQPGGKPANFDQMVEQARQANRSQNQNRSR